MKKVIILSPSPHLSFFFKPCKKKKTHLVKDCTSFICRPKLHLLVTKTDMTTLLTFFLRLPKKKKKKRTANRFLISKQTPQPGHDLKPNSQQDLFPLQPLLHQVYSAPMPALILDYLGKRWAKNTSWSASFRKLISGHHHPAISKKTKKKKKNLE